MSLTVENIQRNLGTIVSSFNTHIKVLKVTGVDFNSLEKAFFKLRDPDTGITTASSIHQSNLDSKELSLLSTVISRNAATITELRWLKEVNPVAFEQEVQKLEKNNPAYKQLHALIIRWLFIPDLPIILQASSLSQPPIGSYSGWSACTEAIKDTDL